MLQKVIKTDTAMFDAYAPEVFTEQELSAAWEPQPAPTAEEASKALAQIETMAAVAMPAAQREALEAAVATLSRFVFHHLPTPF